MASQGKYPRRQWRNMLINQAFQVKYILLFMSGTFAMSSLLGVMLFGVLHYQARQRLLTASTTTAFDNTVAIVGTALVLSVIVALTVGVWTLFVSHRICGPLFIMQRWIGELGNGRIPFCRNLRKHDEFKEFHATLQGAFKALRDRSQVQLQTLTAMHETTQEAVRNGGIMRPGGIEEIVDQIDELRTNLLAFLGDDEDNMPPDPIDCSDSDAKTEEVAVSV